MLFKAYRPQRWLAAYKAMLPWLRGSAYRARSDEAFVRGGDIQVILGPMFAGKTTELIRRMRRYEVANKKCLLVKYNKDNRYDDADVVTHDKVSATATATSHLLPLLAKAKAYDVIAVDEGQFFPDVVEFCEVMANTGKTVLVASLDGTFQRKPFGNSLDIIPLAESIVKLRAICGRCGQDASFSLRLVADTEVELIGGADKYMAVCRQCYHKGTSADAR